MTIEELRNYFKVTKNDELLHKIDELPDRLSDLKIEYKNFKGFKQSYMFENEDMVPSKLFIKCFIHHDNIIGKDKLLAVELFQMAAIKALEEYNETMLRFLYEIIEEVDQKGSTDFYKRYNH